MTDLLHARAGGRVRRALVSAAALAGVVTSCASADMDGVAIEPTVIDRRVGDDQRTDECEPPGRPVEPLRP